MKSKKKILVTGGAGFLGSHLCERLAKNPDYEVYSLDNYFTGSENNHVPGVTYIKGNTADIEKLITFVPDIIYHLGEYSRVEQSFEDIELVWEFNIKGTFYVLEFVRKTGCKLEYFFGFIKKYNFSEINEKLGNDNEYRFFIRYINKESHSDRMNIHDLKDIDPEIFKRAFRQIFEKQGILSIIIQ